MQNPSPTNNHPFHLPKWFVIFCLLFIPPVGWWHMWKNHRYHSWFPYIIWLNSAIMLGFAAYVVLHFYPLLKTFFDTTTYIFISHVGLIFFALFEVLFGFYLIRSFKNKAILKTRMILSIILILFINAIAIPISQLFITTHVNALTISRQSTEITDDNTQSTVQSLVKMSSENIAWQQPVDAKISYTNFSIPNAKPRFINGTSQNGTEIVANLSDAQPEDSAYLKQNGWIVDNNQAADGPTGSVWGYKKTEDGKTQILQLSYTNNSITQVPDQPLQITCPCNLTYKIFLSSLF